MLADRGVAGPITAVVTVADDGGSSGRLRRELGLLPPGDLRMALAALAGEQLATGTARPTAPPPGPASCSTASGAPVPSPGTPSGTSCSQGSWRSWTTR